MSEARPKFGDFSGRVAVVTGASGSIGGAIARALAREGAAVVVTGRNEARLEGVAREIREAGGRAVAVTADLTDPDSVERLRHSVEEQLGPADLVAAVAGGGGEPVPLEELSLERWRQTLDANLTSAFLTLKAFLPGMARRGRGAAVTISSLGGEFVNTQSRHAASPAYSAAKAGLLMLTRQAAREYASQGVRVNCVSPGTVLNARIAAQPDAVRQNLASMHPLGRIGDPDDVAQAALFLLSDASSWITGVTLDVNGGYAML